MSSPFSGAELRELIAKLERLEKWHQDLEGPPSGQPPAKGYTRGDPKTRAAACGPLSEKPGFPAIPPVARLWKCVKEEGAAVAASEFGSIEEGPGPVPDHLQRQADFVSWDSADGLRRITLAFSAGFWARGAIETFSNQFSQPEISSPAQHFVVLRACGLGGYVRFASLDHFARFRDQIFSSGWLYYCFATEIELCAFCEGAKIAVPPLFEPC